MSDKLLFSDLAKYAVGGKNLCTDKTAGKWRAVSYRTAKFGGSFLLSPENEAPGDITLDFKLKGEYKIYIGFIWGLGTASMGISMRGFGKTVIDLLPDQFYPEYHWIPCEFIREYYFTSADMTDNQVTLFKPMPANTCSVAYFRFEPLGGEEKEFLEAKGKGCVNYHFDEDYVTEADYVSEEDYIGRLKILKGLSGRVLFHETSFDDILSVNGALAAVKERDLHEKRLYDYYSRADKIKKAVTSAAAEAGTEVYAAYRMEMANFVYPFGGEGYFQNVPMQDYKGMNIETRDGKTAAVLSYAYKEVRELAVKKILTNCAGFSGVSLIFHRGMHVGFERPVREEVQRRFGVPAQRLPFSDSRLNKVLCGFVTEFMRELRAALSPEVKINIIVYYDPESSKNFGLDVETWAKEGLIDSVAQGIMTHFEDLDGCLADDGLIDLEKYSAVNGERSVVKRYFGHDADKGFKCFVEGSEGFLKICNRYHIGYFGSLGWESIPADMNIDLANAQKKAGVTEFISWNGNHKAKRLQLLSAEKYISRGKQLEGNGLPFVKCTRVLETDGYDISSFSPNWRG